MRQPKHALRNVLHLTVHIVTKKKTDTYMLIYNYRKNHSVFHRHLKDSPNAV